MASPASTPDVCPRHGNGVVQLAQRNMLYAMGILQCMTDGQCRAGQNVEGTGVHAHFDLLQVVYT